MDVLKLMSVLIEQPHLALIPATLFLVCYATSKSRWALATGLAWLLYCLYELGMKHRALCSGECNIRIDLLAIYPALILASIAAVVTTGTAASRRRKA